MSTPAAHKPNAPKKVARAAYKMGDTSEVEVDHLGEKHTLRVLHHVARLHGGSDTALQLSSVLSLSGCASRAMRSPAKYLTETLFKGAQPPELVTLKIGGLGAWREGPRLVGQHEDEGQAVGDPRLPGGARAARASREGERSRRSRRSRDCC